MSTTPSNSSANTGSSGTTTPRTPAPDEVFTSPTVSPQFVGHVGHLDAAQTEALQIFKDTLRKAGLYLPAPWAPTASEEGGTAEAATTTTTTTAVPARAPAASHDDPTLLRFLRARSFQTDAAFTQFRRAEEWRRQNNVDHLFTSKFTIEDFEDARRFYPRWTGRRDKQGLPLYVYRIASLEPLQKELDAISSERRYQRIIVLYEMMVRFTFPLCSHVPHPNSPTPISSTTSIIDLADASFSSMFRLRNHFQEASKLATPYYPETLGTIIVVNSPSFFPTVWSWVKGWFDEGTRHKIHVLGSKDLTPTLLNLIHAKDLPKTYGGELDWRFENEPILDDDVRAVMPNGEMPKGPMVFADGEVKPRDTKVAALLPEEPTTATTV